MLMYLVMPLIINFNYDYDGGKQIGPTVTALDFRGVTAHAQLPIQPRTWSTLRQ